MSVLAPAEVVELLDADPTVEKRASWEAFEFTLLDSGEVKVVNTSHDEPEEHTYTVSVEGGIPFNCTCPAFEYQDGSCKHMVAVAIREPVLEAASEGPTLKADGGTVVEAETDLEERPDDCECSSHFDELPCWPCYCNGFEEPAEVSEE